MNKLFRKNWVKLLAIFLCATIIACAGSNSMIVKLKLTSQAKEALNFMPFNTEFDRKYFSDADQRYSFGILMGVIAEEINERSQLYTYTFDDTDLKNLRTSIINSLIAADHFSMVNDVQTIDDALPSAGLRLFIDFESMGVSQKVAFICEINARAKISNSNDNVLIEKDINVREKGVMTLMAAKNKAIEVFILEVGELLNSV